MDGSFCTVQRPPLSGLRTLIGGLNGYTPVIARRRWRRWKNAAFVVAVLLLWVV